MSFPTLLYLAPAALCALSWLGFGVVLLPRLATGSALLDLLTRAGVGAGSLSLLLFLLGRAGAFRPEVLVALTAALAVPGAWSLARTLRRLWPPPRLRGLVLALALLTALALVLDLIGAATPPTSVDALAYHVEIPHYWLQHGRINDPFFNYAAFYPLGVEMLFAQGLALQGGATASAEHGIIAVLATLATYGLARELGAKRTSAGVIGAALFTLQGIFTWDATSTFVEMGFTFYGIVAVWWAVRYARSPSRLSAALVGLAAGAAAAAKNVGLLVDVVVLAPFAVVALRCRRRSDLVVAAAGVVVLGSYWYIRNWIVAGNPVYPLVFGGKYVTPYFSDYLHGSATIDPGTRSVIPLRILILPLDLLLYGNRFDRGQYTGVAIFVLAALGVWMLRRNRTVLAVAAAAFVYIFVWWYLIPQVRYLFPALAVLSALAGAGTAPLLDVRGRTRIAVAIIAFAVAADWAAPSFALERHLLPVAFGAESRAAFVQRELGTYDAFQRIEKRVGPHALVAFSGYRWPYWYPGPHIWLGWPEFSPDVPAQELLRRMQREGIDYIVSWSHVAEPPGFTRCLRLVASFPARYVTSRSLGISQPITLRLYSTAGCYR